MTVDEGRRLEMFERLGDVLGVEVAETLLAHLPPHGEQVATAAQVEQLRADTTAQIQQLRLETTRQIEQLRAQAIGRIEQLHAETLGRIERLQAETIGRIERLLAETIGRTDQLQAETIGRTDQLQTSSERLRDEQRELRDDVRGLRRDLIVVRWPVLRVGGRGFRHPHAGLTYAARCLSPEVSALPARARAVRDAARTGVFDGSRSGASSTLKTERT